MRSKHFSRSRWLIFAPVAILALFAPSANAEPIAGLQTTYYTIDSVPPTRSDNIYTVCGSEVENNINRSYDGEPYLDCTNDLFMVHMTGFITIPEHDTIEFWLASDDGGSINIDGNEWGNWSDQGCSWMESGQIDISAGSKPLDLWMYENGGNTCILLAWNINNQGWAIVPDEAFTTNGIQTDTDTTVPITTTTDIPVTTIQETTTLWETTTTSTTSTTTTTTSTIAPSTTVPVTPNLTTTTLQTTTTSNPPTTQVSNPTTTTTQTPTTTTTLLPESSETSSTSSTSSTTTTSEVSPVETTLPTTQSTEVEASPSTEYPISIILPEPVIPFPQPSPDVVPDDTIPSVIPDIILIPDVLDTLPNTTFYPSQTLPFVVPTLPDVLQAVIPDIPIEPPVSLPNAPETLDTVNVPSTTFPADTPKLPPLSDAQFEAVLQDLNNALPDQITAIVTTLLTTEVTSEQAVQVVSSPEVLAVISGEQAEQLFDAVDEQSLTIEEQTQIVEAIANAPTTVKKAFENQINIFGGKGFDNYVPVDSNVSVAVRRTIIVGTTILVAMPSPAVRRRRV